MGGGAPMQRVQEDRRANSPRAVPGAASSEGPGAELASALPTWYLPSADSPRLQPHVPSSKSHREGRSAGREEGGAGLLAGLGG